MQDQAKPDALSAQQLQNLQKAYADELKKISHRMELRDRALDQACRVVVGQPVSKETVELAVAMFEFLTADLQTPPPSPDRQTPA